MKSLSHTHTHTHTHTHQIPGNRLNRLLLLLVAFSYLPLISAQDNCNSTFPCYSDMDPSEYEDLPIQYIKVAFHFIAQDYGNGLVNFQCSAFENPYYAPDYVQSMLNTANAVLENPAQSNQTNAADLPDLRLRFTPANGTEDLCNSIYFHTSAPTGLSEDVLHVIFRDGTSTGSAVPGSTVINNYQVHYKAFVSELPPGHTDYGWNARVIAHELGHALGLCHAHSTTTCPEIDVVDECGNNTNPTSCGGPSDCVWNNSNNVMANGVQTGFVHSQWAYFYYNLKSTKYTYFADEEIACEENSAEPLEIQSNTIVTWECAKFVDTDIEIRTGATLIISAPIVMGKNKRIIVNRGARLFVNGGQIYGLSKDCFWGGIVVHGNATKEQPETDDAQNEYVTLTSDDPGVVWLKDAEIHWANTGVTTRGTGSLSTHAYFGGLVMVDNTDFIDCGRAIEFMKYRYKNKSYYKNGSITSTGSVAVSNQGISIWACQNINIDNVVFTGLNDFAVYGISYDATIQNCIFTATVSTGVAIGTDNTMPNSSNDPLRVYNCTFNIYNIGVDAYSSPNQTNGLIIDENTFNGPSTGFPIGINIIGESSYDIYKNSFTTHGANTRTLSTGDLPGNIIRCNEVHNNRFFGMMVAGANEYLEFRGNNFYDSGDRQIVLLGNPFIAKIAEMQGNLSYAAGNTFETPLSAIGADPQQTRQFEYFVKDLDMQGMNIDEKPLNNLSDSGTNNYYNRFSQNVNNACDKGPPPPITDEPEAEIYSEQDLLNARAVTADKLSDYLSSPTNLVEKSEYFVALAKQDSILRYLVQTALDSGEFRLAEDFLLGEGRTSYSRGAVGLRTQRGDIQGADSILYTIPVSTQDDQWFRDIMEINFKIESLDTLYRLTVNEESLLNTIASTDSSIMQGYACAILSLCAGYRCHNSFGEPESYGLIQHSTGTFIGTSDEISFDVFPNPTSKEIIIRSSKPSADAGVIRLYDYIGNLVVHRSFEPDRTVNELIILPVSGLYILSVQLGDKYVLAKKIIRR